MSTTVIRLAQELETDIRRRCLSPGQKYLTAEEGAKQFGASVATANRALQLLAAREVVVRRRNSGTFVGPTAKKLAQKRMRSVIILAPASTGADGSTRYDLLIRGILANLPDVEDVCISYVPAEGRVAFVRRILEPIRDSGHLMGVIAISSSRDVYRYLGKNKYPLVVIGSLYSDQPFPSIVLDENGAGKMLTKYLLDRGHRRIAIFSHSETQSGDNLFRDGVSEVLTSAGMPHNALVWRTPGYDPAVFRTQVMDVLSARKRPTGIIVKLPHWADDILSILTEYGLREPEDVEIVFKDLAVSGAGKSRFPHVRPTVSFQKIAERAGQMLALVRQNRILKQQTVVIPYLMYQSREVRTLDEDHIWNIRESIGTLESGGIEAPNISVIQ